MSVGSHTHDHELKVDSTTKGFKLARRDDGSVIYQVLEDIPKYQDSLKFIMRNWQGGHGQFSMKQPDVYFSGQSIDTTQEGKVILGPLIYQVGLAAGALDGNPVCSCWFSAISKLMVATAAKVYWYDGTNLVMKEDFTAIGTIVDMVEYNGYLYVALGTGAAYYYSVDGDAFTACTLTDHHAVKFMVSPNAAGTANVLWKSLTPNQIASTTDGRNIADGGSQWSSAAYIGDTSNNITNIFLVNDNLMVGRTDNLFNYDSDGGVHPLMDDLKHNRTTKNFQYITQWQTATYVSLGTGLGELTSYNTFQPMGALTDINDIGKVGACVGLTSDKDYMYIAMDEGTNTHIYKGGEVRRNGVLRWEWCPFVFLSTNDCATIRVVQHTSTDRRLWFGYGNYAGYVILTDNPLADSAARFAASGFLRMSYDYGSNPYWDKMWQSVVTETKGCAVGITVTPKYWKDTDTSATDLTAAISSNGVVKTDLTTPLSCKRITFEVDLATNNSAITPEVTYFEARGVERPEKIRIHETVYVIGDEPSRKAETIRSFFRDARVTTNLMRFADLRYGESTASSSYVWVVMMPGYPQEVDILHEKGRAPELGIKCRFIEVNFATGAYTVTSADYATAILSDGSRTFAANQSMGGYALTSVGNVKYSTTTELTIATGAITPTQFLHTVDTEANAASDDLDTVTNTAGLSWVILRAENDARTIVIKHNTGNIWLRGVADVTLDDVEDSVLLFWDTVNSKWFDVVGSGGVTAHSALTGLTTGDDHTQYQKESERAVASGYASLNASTKVVEQPASISDFLDDTAGGTDALLTKAPTSNVLYDAIRLTKRNIIINGGFTINQRAYVSAAALAAGIYGHDRWKGGAGGGTYSFTQLASPTTITIAADKTLIQVIEDKMVYGGTYILSWTGTCQARYAINSATPAGAYADSPITITGQTAGTVMSVEFGNGAASGTLGLVQLELGSVATPFEFRPYGQEVALCQRYYEKSFDITVTPADTTDELPACIGGYCVSIDYCYTSKISFKVIKRVSPTMVIYNSHTGGTAGQWAVRIAGGAYIDALSNFYADIMNSTAFDYVATKSASFVEGDSVALFGNWTAACEL